MDQLELNKDLNIENHQIHCYNENMFQQENNDKKTIYNDSQNVHNTTINESVITAAKTLIEKMVATVTFDGRYKFNVFKDDTSISITNRLAEILNKNPEDVIIIGDNGTHELQPRMTYKILKKDEIKKDENIINSRFKPEDVEKYSDVFGLEDYIFPNNVVRDGELGRRLEEIFLVTNKYLIHVFEKEIEEELLFYLDICGIKDAELIWFERDEILNDLFMVIGNDLGNDRSVDVLNEVFINEVFKDMDNMNSFIDRVKTSNVRDINILELLNAVWKFIHTKNGETIIEMKKRFKEEILESMNVCTSGICAHLVSVIQGYFDEDIYPSLKIKISTIDEMKARIYRSINVIAMEKDIDPMIDHDDFKKLIDEYIEANVKLLSKEFDISKEKIIDITYKMYIDDGIDETD
jgi:hypothetical protein